MATKFERLLSLLSDDIWHDPNDVAKKLEIPQDKLQQVIPFLIETDLVQLNPATNQIKLKQNWKTLILSRTERELEMEPEIKSVGTIVIPPQRTIIIQSTRITNLTDKSLELEFRMAKRLSEIAISKLE